MISKPLTGDGFDPEQSARVRETCLYIATKLGDLLKEIVVVGGLVPYLLVDQDDLPAGSHSHAGTMDLDMGLALAILNQERYRELGARLRNAGFQAEVNDQGNLRLQTWTAPAPLPVKVDFLIPPADDTAEGHRVFHIESDLAAIVTPGLDLAFKDRRWKEVSGRIPLAPRLPGAFRYAAQVPSPSSRHLPSETGQRTRTPTICSTYGAESASPMS